jgi:hypothetical protein
MGELFFWTSFVVHVLAGISFILFYFFLRSLEIGSFPVDVTTGVDIGLRRRRLRSPPQLDLEPRLPLLLLVQVPLLRLLLETI